MRVAYYARLNEIEAAGYPAAFFSSLGFTDLLVPMPALAVDLWTASAGLAIRDFITRARRFAEGCRLWIGTGATRYIHDAGDNRAYLAPWGDNALWDTYTANLRAFSVALREAGCFGTWLDVEFYGKSYPKQPADVVFNSPELSQIFLRARQCRDALRSDYPTLRTGQGLVYGTVPHPRRHQEWCKGAFADDGTPDMTWWLPNGPVSSWPEANERITREYRTASCPGLFLVRGIVPEINAWLKRMNAGAWGCWIFPDPANLGGADFFTRYPGVAKLVKSELRQAG